MNYLFKCIVAIGLLFCYYNGEAKSSDTQYPAIDSVYKYDEIRTFLTEFEKKKDTLGILFTIGAYHLIQPSYDSLNIKYLPFLIRNIERMAEVSLIDYHKLKIVILSYYVKSDKSHLKQASELCREIRSAAIENGWDKLILETYFMEYRIMLLTKGVGQEKDFFKILSRYKRHENSVTDFGLLYNFYSGFLYWQSGDFVMSIKHFKKTQLIGEKINRVNLTLTAKLFICQLNRILKNYQESLKYGIESLKMSEKSQLVDLQRWTHEELALLYETGFKDYSLANTHWKKYFNLIKQQESIKQSTPEVPDLQLQLIEERLSSENERLNLSNKLISSELKSQSVILQLSVSIAILLALIAVLIYIWAKQFKKTAEYNKYLLINETQELERQKMSQELHDSVGSYIFAIKGYLHSGIPHYHQVIDYLNKVYSQIRQTSHILSAQGISEVGLVESCQDFIKLFNENYDIVFQTHGNVYELPNNFSIQIYRVIQEIILNTIKHADASRIFVNLYYEKQKFMLNVADNGNGFDTAIKYKGLGVSHIQRSVNILNGKIELTSTEEGTSYWIIFPFKKP